MVDHAKVNIVIVLEVWENPFIVKATAHVFAVSVIRKRYGKKSRAGFPCNVFQSCGNSTTISNNYPTLCKVAVPLY